MPAKGARRARSTVIIGRRQEEKSAPVAEEAEEGQQGGRLVELDGSARSRGQKVMARTMAWTIGAGGGGLGGGLASLAGKIPAYVHIG